jgi:hypothetical protein
VRQEEGTNGISDPQLWLYAHGDPNVVGHTSILYDTVSPRWPERDIICFDPAASDDGTFCVQISDDWPRDYLNRGPVLNDGCGPVPLEAGEHSVVLTKGARLWYTAVLAPPPAPPKPPPFDLTGKLNVAKCDAMMRDPTHIFRQMWEARQFMRLRREGGIPCFERAREDISRGQVRVEAVQNVIPALCGAHCDAFHSRCRRPLRSSRTLRRANGATAIGMRA